MKKETAKEIIACLPRDKTLFHYHKDRYAVLLLAEVARQGTTVAELKRSVYGRLLSRPLIRNVVQKSVNGEIRQHDLM